MARRYQLTCLIAFLALGLIGFVEGQASVSTAEWRRMTAALKRKGGYSTFLYHANNAEMLARLSSLIKQGNWRVTIFAPTDAAFKSSPRFTYYFRHKLCYSPVGLGRYGCSVPMVLFMVVQGTLTVPVLQRVPVNSRWRTLFGDEIQKFSGPGRFRFFIGPSLEKAKRRVGGYIVDPAVYNDAGAGLLVHGIGALLPPPTLFPDGFV